MVAMPPSSRRAENASIVRPVRCSAKTTRGRRLRRQANPPDQIFLLRAVLRANGECIQQPQTESELQRLILPVAHIALPQNLHSHDAFSGGLHLSDYADHRLRVRIRV